MERARPVLIVNPPDDPIFAEAVDRALVMATTPAQLEAALRARFPAVTARARDLAGEPKDTWYVYRDGRWTPSAA